MPPRRCWPGRLGRSSGRRSAGPRRSGRCSPRPRSRSQSTCRRSRRARVWSRGWSVAATALPLDPAFPAWGDSRYCDVRLSGTLRLSDALSQLYVLLPVLDGSKHYWISAEEVDKLLRAGEAWLPVHPDRELITRRYLGRRPTLVRSALARLAESDEVDES